MSEHKTAVVYHEGTEVGIVIIKDGKEVVYSFKHIDTPYGAEGHLARALMPQVADYMVELLNKADKIYTTPSGARVRLLKNVGGDSYQVLYADSGMTDTFVFSELDPVDE